MCTLLMTAAIAPSIEKGNQLTIYNIDERLKYYRDAIKYYLLQSIFQNIIFCDNSNYKEYSFQEERLLASKRKKNLEIIHYEGNKNLIQLKGKGYGDGECIKYAIRNSLILKNCNSFYKVTGRLLIENIDEVLTKSLNDEIVFRIFNPKNDAVDTRFFKCSIDFFETTLIDVFYECDDNNKYFWFEKIYFRQLINIRIGEFRVLPKIIGKSATSGRIYRNLRTDFIFHRLFNFFSLNNHLINIKGAKKYIYKYLLFNVYRILVFLNF